MNPVSRAAHGFFGGEDAPVSVVLELSALHVDGFEGSWRRLARLVRRVQGGQRRERPALARIAAAFAAWDLSVAEADDLVREDRRRPDRGAAAIERIWLDYLIRPLAIRARSLGTMGTIKADSARQLFGADGFGLTWAVIDAGVDRSHPHFDIFDTLGGDVKQLHHDFLGTTGGSPLDDRLGTGTAAAGMIAGGLPEKLPRGVTLRLPKRDEDAPLDGDDQDDDADLAPPQGIAPHCRVISLKVIGDRGQGSVYQMIAALEYVRERLNGGSLRVQGVNLGVGLDYDPSSGSACGDTPICQEVDKLVKSGGVVVVPAGNGGFGDVSTHMGIRRTGLLVTINDPGNAELAITVGSANTDKPHRLGVSPWSSKGPTADGRLKPDLIAPGENILSCRPTSIPDDASASARRRGRIAAYRLMSGTSISTAHVSGAVAAFLSVHGEFIGRPEEVKRIFLDSATSLGRDPYFQGRGLVNLMRALQAV